MTLTERERHYRRASGSLEKLETNAAWEAEQPQGCTLAVYLVAAAIDVRGYLDVIEREDRERDRRSRR